MATSDRFGAHQTRITGQYSACQRVHVKRAMSKEPIRLVHIRLVSYSACQKSVCQKSVLDWPVADKVGCFRPNNHYWGAKGQKSPTTSPIIINALRIDAKADHLVAARSSSGVPIQSSTHTIMYPYTHTIIKRALQSAKYCRHSL